MRFVATHYLHTKEVVGDRVVGKRFAVRKVGESLWLKTEWEKTLFPSHTLIGEQVFRDGKPVVYKTKLVNK